MAYTSTVGLALTPEAFEKLREWSAALPKDDRKAVQEFIRSADIHKTKRGAHLFFWNLVPWDDKSVERRFLEGLVNSLSAEEYHLCRTGDALFDNEDRGSFADPFDLRLRREVTVG